ncbi:MAG: hypothetical protein WDO71_14625 [Bacteroidota bacterium]
MKQISYSPDFLCSPMIASAQQKSLSQQMAETVMKTWKDSFALDGRQAKWSYDMGGYSERL